MCPVSGPCTEFGYQGVGQITSNKNASGYMAMNNSFSFQVPSGNPCVAIVTNQLKKYVSFQAIGYQVNSYFMTMRYPYTTSKISDLNNVRGITKDDDAGFFLVGSTNTHS